MFITFPSVLALVFAGQSPALPYSGLNSKGPKNGVHALLVCARGSGFSFDAGPKSCCTARGKPNKNVLVQTVHVQVNCKVVELMILGVNFDTHDGEKAEQIELLLREVRRQQADASRQGHLFQAILVGDINDRIVLKTDARLDVEVAYMRPWTHMRKVVSLTNRSQAILRHLLVTNHGRRELLSWDVKYFDDTAVGGVSVRHPSRTFCDAFFLQTDWWRESQRDPEPVTYKYTPWDQLVASDIVDDIANVASSTGRNLHNLNESRDSDDGWAVSFAELERALRVRGRATNSLDPTSMPSFFMMSDHIPKTKFQVEDAQTYLNSNMKKDPVYLSFGWLDSVGFLRPKLSGNLGFDMVFLDFETDFGVRGGDHAFTHARLYLMPAGAVRKNFLGQWVWAIGGGAAVLGLLVCGMCKHSRRCWRRSNTD